MPDEPSKIVIYKPEGDTPEIQVRLEDGTLWLTQRQMAELFQTTIPNISMHIQNIFNEGELSGEGTIKEHLMVGTEGARQVSRSVAQYNLDVIISVGYRVKSHIGTRFRIWATNVLREYLVKGFAMNDKRLMEGGSDNRYFEELLGRIRAIRASERMFYQKITDIYATSVDYDINAEITRTFFATIQNKFHYAIHRHTASELIVERASARKPNMGLTNWKAGPKGPIRKTDATVAKNYLTEDELAQLNLIVDQYLSFAELQAKQKKTMHMADWVSKLHEFLRLNDRDILRDLGKVSHDLAKQLAEKEFDKFDSNRRALESTNPSDFDEAVKVIEDLRKQPKKPRQPPRRRK